MGPSWVKFFDPTKLTNFNQEVCSKAYLERLGGLWVSRKKAPATTPYPLKTINFTIVSPEITGISVRLKAALTLVTIWK